MPQSEIRVPVFSFLTLDRGVESSEVSLFKATRESIRDHFVGVVLESTAEEVDASTLDAEGRHSRHPTGWGELGA